MKVRTLKLEINSPLQRENYPVWRSDDPGYLVSILKERRKSDSIRNLELEALKRRKEDEERCQKKKEELEVVETPQIAILMDGEASEKIKHSKQRRRSIRKERAAGVVTGSALTFVIIAAILVTTTFLMSPAIEEMFGEQMNY